MVTKTKKPVKRVKKTKLRNPKVSAHKFTVETPASPEMGKGVVSFKWNLYDKNFTMKIAENCNMDAFTWIDGIKNAYDQATLHSHLAAHDMVFVTLFDQNGKQLAKYRFAKLTLIAHKTELGNCFNMNAHDGLTHDVTVTFERVEKDTEPETT